MTNAFQRIGNNIEKEKLKKKKFKDRYWKLSPIERMEYDKKLERIEREWNTPAFSITKVVIKFLFVVTLLVILWSFGVGYSLEKIINSLRILSFSAYRLLLVAILLDCLFMLVEISFNNSHKKIKELKKRFNL